MWRSLCALFVAAGVSYGAEAPGPTLLSFDLKETPAVLSEALRRAPNIVEEPGCRVLRFSSSAAAAKARVTDPDYEWEFFYSEDGVLQSVTWNSEKPVSAATLFPEDDRRVVNAVGSKATVLVRELPGGRVLIAYVDSRSQTELRQAVLVRAGSLNLFFPWLASADTRHGKSGKVAKAPAALAIRGLADRH